MFSKIWTTHGHIPSSYGTSKLLFSLYSTAKGTRGIFRIAFLTWYHSAELHTGIIAACLPALRPLFSSFLETASRGLRATGYMYGSSRYGNRYGSKSNNRSGYHRQEDAVGLENLQRMNRTEDNTMYKANVTSTNETGISRGDDSSEDGILPPKGAVIKTTHISITEGRPGK